MVSFCAVLFFPRDVLDEILNLIESVSEGFPSYSFIRNVYAATITISLLFILMLIQCNMISRKQRKTAVIQQ